MRGGRTTAQWVIFGIFMLLVAAESWEESESSQSGSSSSEETQSRPRGSDSSSSSSESTEESSEPGRKCGRNETEYWDRWRSECRCRRGLERGANGKCGKRTCSDDETKDPDSGMCLCTAEKERLDINGKCRECDPNCADGRCVNWGLCRECKTHYFLDAYNKCCLDRFYSLKSSSRKSRKLAGLV
ncbi:hypothetical protein BSKO_05029 [Bryopsis sp. KO-2023]|nr:hypothetical protein BSKO_05029 [Bryopsis sp. KO-2023]